MPIINMFALILPNYKYPCNITNWAHCWTQHSKVYIAFKPVIKYTHCYSIQLFIHLKCYSQFKPEALTQILRYCYPLDIRSKTYTFYGLYFNHQFYTLQL